VALCDTYEPLMNRAKREFAPNAQTFTDYHQLLALKKLRRWWWRRPRTCTGKSSRRP